MSKFIIGLDPGKSGGWGFIDLKSSEISYGKFNSKGDYLDIDSLVSLTLNKLSNSLPSSFLVVVEKVHSMPGQGVRSMFSFGTSFGILLGFCQALNLPHLLVSPVTWKKEILFDTKKDKEAAISYVKRKFPTVDLTNSGKHKPHDGIADALCLMSWGCLKYGKD